ncbi:hypothetical protein [uncultured Jatrophihabitans sp.]|uniref:hypothetical protein n=1 Tax=uncultured Jatrophihabitans sp. TaxID=1610747 RepID=UPI0035CB2739
MPDHSDEPKYGRDTTAYGTNADHDVDEEPSGARGSKTEHGLTGKLKQAVNSVTGNDLDTATPEENERGNAVGGGGSDGR